MWSSYESENESRHVLYVVAAWFMFTPPPLSYHNRGGKEAIHMSGRHIVYRILARLKRQLQGTLPFLGPMLHMVRYGSHLHPIF